MTVGCQSSGTWNSSVVGTCTPGAKAFISEDGLLNERLSVCNLTGTNFVGCVGYTGFSSLRSVFAEGNTVWIADEARSSGSVTVCTLTPSNNTLSGCIVSTLTGFTGTRDPVGLVVKSGVAYVANRDTACGLIVCTNAAAMTGCSCALTAAQNARNVRGITISPDGTRIFFTSQTAANGVDYGIVTCPLIGTSLGTCSTSASSGTMLSGIHATNSNVYVVARFTSLLVTYARVWVCNPISPSPGNCLQTGTGFATGVLANDPWGVSVFDGVLYVPDNDNVEECNAATASGCTSSGLLNLSPVLSGTTSIFIQPCP